jgi:hypothetical protein
VTGHGIHNLGLERLVTLLCSAVGTSDPACIGQGSVDGSPLTHICG